MRASEKKSVNSTPARARERALTRICVTQNSQPGSVSASRHGQTKVGQASERPLVVVVVVVAVAAGPANNLKYHDNGSSSNNNNKEYQQKRQQVASLIVSAIQLRAAQLQRPAAHKRNNNMRCMLESRRYSSFFPFARHLLPMRWAS